MKSIIAWVGGKAKLMWLINLLAPMQYERSIDVFGGSGTVTLNLDCPKSCTQVYNDFNRNLVNLMQCARDKPLALLKEIGFIHLNSRGDFDTCADFIEQNEIDDEDFQEELAMTEILFDPPTAAQVRTLLEQKHRRKDVKRAAIYYKLLRHSFNANGKTFGGKKFNIRNFFADIWRFSRLFANVVIENKDFESLIKQYDRPNAFIYCDPPYYDAEDFYAVGFPKEDHVRLRDTLQNAQGYVMVSYNNCPEIRELYKDFYIFLTTRPHSMSKKEGEVYEELIMTNYNPDSHIQQKTLQTNLFQYLYRVHCEGEYALIHTPNQPLKS